MATGNDDITDKQAVIEVLSRLPDDASIDEIRYECDTICSVLESLAAADRGETVPHEVVLEDLARWRRERTADDVIPIVIDSKGGNR
jgi:predicted transcriptional regulator